MEKGIAVNREEFFIEEKNCYWKARSDREIALSITQSTSLHYYINMKFKISQESNTFHLQNLHKSTIFVYSC
mgnify:CR=1 FL=1